MPIVFTELGYQSRLGTTEQPSGGDGAASEQAQAIAYEGAFRALVDDPWFEGIWWREWSAEGLAADGDGGGFTPEGKLASGVLAEWQGPPDPLG